MDSTDPTGSLRRRDFLGAALGGAIGLGSAAAPQFDPATGRPRAWPLRFTIAHWAARLPALPPGNRVVRCRAVDGNGLARPMPRPLPKSGENAVERAHIAGE